MLQASFTLSNARSTEIPHHPNCTQTIFLGYVRLQPSQMQFSFNFSNCFHGRQKMVTRIRTICLSKSTLPFQRSNLMISVGTQVNLNRLSCSSSVYAELQDPSVTPSILRNYMKSMSTEILPLPRQRSIPSMTLVVLGLNILFYTLLLNHISSHNKQLI